MGGKRHNYKSEVTEVLKTLLGKKVIHSRAGGGAGSILLQRYQNGIQIWAWSYWEISQRETLIATADDDITSIIGIVATGARTMEGKRLLGFQLWPDLTICLYFEDDIDYIIFPAMEKDFLSWEIKDKSNDAVYELNENRKLIKRPYWSHNTFTSN